MTREIPSETQPTGAASETPSEEGTPVGKLTSKEATDESHRPEESPARSAQADQAESAESSPVKPAKPPIETIEALLMEAFESKSRVITFGTDKLKRLPMVDDQLKTHEELVATFAKADPTLNGPFKLLQFVASRGVPLDRNSDLPLVAVLGRLRDLALMALSHHPVFQVWTEELAEPDRTPELTVKVVRDAVAKVSATTLGLPDDRFKKSDKDHLLRNAIACLSLVRALQGRWDLDRFIDEYRSVLWSADVPKALTFEKAAGLLSASREGGLLGLVSDVYEGRVRARDQEITRLKGEATRDARRIQSLEEQKQEAGAREEALVARSEALSSDVVRLRKELDAERDNRVVDKSHATDDYETLRTRIIRRLTEEVDLLTDALHALRNGASPVAEEFLDRSLVKLSREVELLKDAAGGLK